MISKKAARVWYEEGPTEFVKKSVRFGYNNYVRPMLPKKSVRYNEVPVKAAHFGDDVISWQKTDLPTYEEAIIENIRSYVSHGDRVVIVGGGWGVSTVAAANQTGEAGTVITYEGARESLKKVQQTVSLNSVGKQVSVRYAVIAEAISLRGNSDAETIPPEELPECDVLVLDCEGAEINILENMSIRPDVLIIETHGMFDAPVSMVSEKMQNLGYNITEPRFAEERLKRFCEENGIYVISGFRE